jgi:opacity protein-like surface antigen
VSGALLGGQVGCNYQARWVVVGLELESSWASANESKNFATGATSQIRSFSDVAFRFGAPIDRLLLYGKVGLGVSQYSFNINPSLVCNFCVVQGPNVSVEKGMMGVVVGAGAEYLITPHWTAKIQADILFTPSLTIGTGTTQPVFFGFPQNSAPTTSKVTTSSVRLGTNYKF